MKLGPGAIGCDLMEGCENSPAPQRWENRAFQQKSPIRDERALGCCAGGVSFSFSSYSWECTCSFFRRDKVKGIVPPGKIGAAGPVVVAIAVLDDDLPGFRYLVAKIEGKCRRDDFILGRADDADRMAEVPEVGNAVVAIDQEQTDGKPGIMGLRDIGEGVPWREESQSPDGDVGIGADRGRDAGAERFAPDIEGTVG